MKELYTSPWCNNYTVKLDEGVNLPRHLAINDRRYQKYKNQKVVSLRVGDLVSWLWTHTASAYFTNTLFYKCKTIGLIVDTRWTLIDYHDASMNLSYFYLKEAVILWEDGETTNSSQDSLNLIKRGRNGRKKDSDKN